MTQAKEATNNQTYREKPPCDSNPEIASLLPNCHSEEASLPQKQFSDHPSLRNAYS